MIKIRQTGGKVKGPSHAQGGVPVVTTGGNPAREPESGQQYEIEGGERVFSVEDTREIERMSKVLSATKGPDSDKVAAKLGYFVAQAVSQQDDLDKGGTEVPEVLKMGSAAGNVPDTEPTEYIE